MPNLDGVYLYHNHACIEQAKLLPHHPQAELDLVVPVLQIGFITAALRRCQGRGQVVLAGEVPCGGTHHAGLGRTPLVAGLAGVVLDQVDLAVEAVKDILEQLIEFLDFGLLQIEVAPLHLLEHTKYSPAALQVPRRLDLPH